MPTRHRPTVRRLAQATVSGLVAVLTAAGPSHGIASAEGDVVTSLATTTAFGAVVKPLSGETYPQALARSESRYGRLGVIRYFDGNYPDPWSSYNEKLTDHTTILSFRIAPSTVNSGSADDALRSWFGSAPTDHTVYWSYMHEPEDEIARGSYTASAYRAAWTHVAGIADEVAGTNANLVSTLIMMCYTVNPASGRDWTDYYAGPEVIDVLGWDCYNHGERRGVYGDPAKLYSRAIATSRNAGKPWGMAEIGSRLAAGDITGEGRAAWLTRVARYLYDEGALFTSYFDTNGAGSDYRLLDEPSRQAWYDVVSDQNPY